MECSCSLKLGKRSAGAREICQRVPAAFLSNSMMKHFKIANCTRHQELKTFRYGMRSGMTRMAVSQTRPGRWHHNSDIDLLFAVRAYHGTLTSSRWPPCRGQWPGKLRNRSRRVMAAAARARALRARAGAQGPGLRRPPRPPRPSGPTSRSIIVTSRQPRPCQCPGHCIIRVRHGGHPSRMPVLLGS